MAYGIASEDIVAIWLFLSDFDPNIKTKDLWDRIKAFENSNDSHFGAEEGDAQSSFMSLSYYTHISLDYDRIIEQPLSFWIPHALKFDNVYCNDSDCTWDANFEYGERPRYLAMKELFGTAEKLEAQSPENIKEALESLGWKREYIRYFLCYLWEEPGSPLVEVGINVFALEDGARPETDRDIWSEMMSHFQGLQKQDLPVNIQEEFRSYQRLREGEKHLASREVVQYFATSPKDKLLKIINRIAGREITWNQIGNTPGISYADEGNHKYIFKATFYAKDKQDVNVVLAFNMPNVKDGIKAVEISDLKKLDRIMGGKQLPRFGSESQTEFGAYYFLEEFIHGETVYSLQEEGRLSDAMRKQIVDVLLEVADNLDGMAIFDFHARNFMVTDSGRVVLVDLGHRRLDLTGKGKGTQDHKILFLASLLAQYGYYGQTGKTMLDDFFIFSRIEQFRGKTINGSQWLKQVREETMSMDEEELELLFFSKIPWAFGSFGNYREKEEFIKGFVCFFRQALGEYGI